MSAEVWYSSELTCANCHSVVGRADSRLFTIGLSPDFGNVWLGVGELLDMGESDLLEAFPPTPSWPHPGPMRVLEHWQCPVCETSQGVVFTFIGEEPAGWRLVDQQAQLLDDALDSGVDGISTQLRWVFGDPDVRL